MSTRIQELALLPYLPYAIPPDSSDRIQPTLSETSLSVDQSNQNPLPHYAGSFPNRPPAGINPPPTAALSRPLLLALATPQEVLSSSVVHAPKPCWTPICVGIVPLLIGPSILAAGLTLASFGVISIGEGAVIATVGCPFGCFCGVKTGEKIGIAPDINRGVDPILLEPRRR